MKKLIMMFLAVGTFLAIAATNPDVTGYKVGDTAEDFKLKGTDGKMHSLADFKGVAGYVVIFTCNHCPYAVMYEDRIKEVATAAKEMGFGLIAVNPNDPDVQPEDNFDAMVVRAKEKEFNFPYVMDEGQSIFPKYGATRTPHVFIMDDKMVVQYIGAVDDNARNAAAVKINYIKNAMTSIKSGKTPDPSFTKAIGCGIKSKA